MSPTSYLAAPPRGELRILPRDREHSTPCDQLPEPLGVAGREDLPVVVEVREDLGGFGQPADPRRPLAQLALGIVAAVAAAAVVEAQVGPVGGQDLRGGPAAAVVVEHERGAVLAQQR